MKSDAAGSIHLTTPARGGGRERSAFLRQRVIRALLVAGIGLWAGLPLHAQWLTQSFALRAGWNAVYLNLDASHATLDDLLAAEVGHPIEEIWHWNPAAPTAQFTQNPALPSETGTPWTSWKLGQGEGAVLQRLTGNSAYLVRVATGAPPYTWNLKGKPVAPLYDWTTTGLNFLGFPTPPAAPPSFTSFLQPAPALMNSAEIFRYPGGPLGASNPTQVFALDATPARRGEAFWIRAGEVFNRYFGPFALEILSGSGIHFSDTTGPHSLRLRNLSPGELTVTLAMVPSEPPPVGQPTIVDVPPVLLRGALNTVNLTFGHTNLAAPRTWTLKPAGQPGSEVEVVLGVDRSKMPGQPGDLYAAVLRFTDSLALTQVELPVTATVASKAGLWVGAAAVTQVQHYLKKYKEDGDGNPVLGPDGRYTIESIKDDLGSVARPYPLRLIVHADAAGGNAKLLQRVYLGVKRDTTVGITTTESLLDPAQLARARRISSVHLPWSAANVPWSFAGELRAGSALSTTVSLAYADPAANPFVHGYHPDHDNLNATFDGPVARGEESYAVDRRITLRLQPPGADFASLTRGHTALTGDYEERLTFTGVTKPGRTDPERRWFEVRGGFVLNRITDPLPLTTE